MAASLAKLTEKLHSMNPCPLWPNQVQPEVGCTLVTIPKSCSCDPDRYSMRLTIILLVLILPSPQKMLILFSVFQKKMVNKNTRNFHLPLVLSSNNILQILLPMLFCKRSKMLLLINLGYLLWRTKSELSIWC